MICDVLFPISTCRLLAHTIAINKLSNTIPEIMRYTAKSVGPRTRLASGSIGSTGFDAKAE